MKHPEQAREPINLVLSPINPFNPRQQDVTEKILEGKSVLKTAEELGIAYGTCKNLIHGKGTPSETNMLGITGLIEKYTGERSASDFGWLMLMIGDVIVAESTLPRDTSDK